MKFCCALLGAFAAVGLATGLESTAEMDAAPGYMNEVGIASRKAKEAYWASKASSRISRRSISRAAATCVGGSVYIDGERFGCSGIDFDSFLSLADARIPTSGGTNAASDIWGWLSPEGREITLWTVDNGLWFIDTTEPTNPLRLGYMSANRGRTSWSDVKVYQNTAYFVKDNGSGSTGIQVFDLTRLAGLGDDPSRSFTADFIYSEHGRCHNIVSSPETGFLYSVGTNTCSGGLHMINVSNPLQPTSAGCVSSDGYTHDAQCVIYKGPDSRYTDREICLAFNEDTLTIWDVTDKANVQQLGRQGYPTSEYTHQGWFTDDFKYVLLNDEQDEMRGTVSTTTTYVVEVIDLENPIFVPSYEAKVVSIDHNLYFWGSMHKRGHTGSRAMENPPNVNYAYLANYVSGVRVIDVTDITNIHEIGHFDVAPDMRGNIFDGAWSTYMHPSGSLAVSSIDRGLFLLRPTMAFDGTAPPSPVLEPTPFPTSPPLAAPTIPGSWNCNMYYYSAADGCDCNCGAPDPDCDFQPDILYNCQSGQVCIEGICSQPVDEEENPWTCNINYFDAADGCDCNCGIPDPDCELEDQLVHGCTPDQRCVEGVCQ